MADSQAAAASPEDHVDSESEPEVPPTDGDGADTAQNPAASAAARGKKKRKRSKKSKLVSALTGHKAGDGGESSSAAKPAADLSDESMKALLDMNPSLKGELSGLPPDRLREVLQKTDVLQLLSGLSINGKNQKDMASYKFWSTQPVPKLDERPDTETPDGPIKKVVPELVPKTAAPLPDDYEWVELDLNDQKEVEEVYTLLSLHYVEDANAMFRFDYSAVFLDWALKSPEWKKSWHIGVRAKGPGRRLVATIFGIPIKLRVRENVLDVVEINFMCVHKKLRSKRLAPVLIKEVTRRCHLEGTYQAIYTGGSILPTPVGSCRYFHRSIDWQKLNDVGFAHPYGGKSIAQLVAENRLPPTPTLAGWRKMEEKDVDAVLDLLARYVQRFDLAQVFTRAEIRHWFVNTLPARDQVVWSFVVEHDGRITDFASFYCLESTVIAQDNQPKPKHDKIRAAYLYYYATEDAFNAKEKGLKQRLLKLIGDLMIEAQKARFDVFNALTLHDNPLFLADDTLKFRPGDGQLYHYLYNWRTKPINGGVNKQNEPDVTKRGGIGIVLL